MCAADNVALSLLTQELAACDLMYCVLMAMQCSAGLQHVPEQRCQAAGRGYCYLCRRHSHNQQHPVHQQWAFLLLSTTTGTALRHPHLLHIPIKTLVLAKAALNRCNHPFHGQFVLIKCADSNAQVNNHGASLHPNHAWNVQSGGALAIGIDEFEVSDSCDATGVTSSSSNIVVR